MAALTVMAAAPPGKSDCQQAGTGGSITVTRVGSKRKV